MTAPDLTPAEARAEVEAFMGEGWNVTISSESPAVFVHAFLPQPGPFACVDGHGPTYRAAVDALKQAWRDAVRPWVREASNKAFDEGCDYIVSKEPVEQQVRIDRAIHRVLKEPDHE